MSVAVLLTNIHKSRAVTLYLIKHRMLTGGGFIDFKSLHVIYYRPFSRLMSFLEHLERKERAQIKSKNNRPTPEIPHERRINLRVSARVCRVERGAVCSKNSTFGYFDGTTWTPRLRSSTPIMAPGK